MNQIYDLRQVYFYAVNLTESFVGAGLLPGSSLTGAEPLCCVSGLHEEGGYEALIKLVTGIITRIAHGKRLPITKVMSDVVYEALLAAQAQGVPDARNGGEQ